MVCCELAILERNEQKYRDNVTVALFIALLQVGTSWYTTAATAPWTTSSATLPPQG